MAAVTTMSVLGIKIVNENNFCFCVRRVLESHLTLKILQLFIKQLIQMDWRDLFLRHCILNIVKNAYIPLILEKKPI